MYQSDYPSDNESFKKGDVTPLNGRPYASIIYNTEQEIVSQDYTYYTVWESDLKHQLNGSDLQESRIYSVRPIQKTHIIDGVAHTTKYVYEFAPIHLMLREEVVEGTAINGEKEEHKTRYTYASEHYTPIRLQNRLTEHFMTVQSVKKGRAEEIITSVDVTAYDTFTINEKELLAPKNYYKAKEVNATENYRDSSAVIGEIVADIAAQEQAEKEYEEKTEIQYKKYKEVLAAAEFILLKEKRLNYQIHQLNSELHELVKDVDNYKKIVLENHVGSQSLHTTITRLHQEIEGFNTGITDKQNKINSEYSNINIYSRNINLGWIGGLIGYGISYGINHPKIEAAKNRIYKLRIGIQKLKQNIQQKRNEVFTKRTELIRLIDEDHVSKLVLQQFESALIIETQKYHTLKAQVGNSVIKSHNALKEHFRVKTITEEHKEVITDIVAIKESKLHDEYSTALDALINSIPSGIQIPRLTSNSLRFQDEIKNKIEKLKEKITAHKITIFDLGGKHQKIIAFIKDKLNTLLPQETTFPNYKWVNTQVVISRDSSTGVPTVTTDEKGIPYYVTLDPNHKKPMVIYEGIKTNNSKIPVKYYNFEQDNQRLFGCKFSTESHTGNRSIKLKNIGGKFSERLIDTKLHTHYLLSAWIKIDKNTISPASVEIGFDDQYQRFSASNKWQYVEVLIDSGKIPQIKGKGDILLDDLLIRPVSYKTNIIIRDDNDKMVSNISNNGNTIHHVYDDAQRFVVSIEDQGKVTGYTQKYYSREDQEEKYNPENPNSILDIQFLKKGFYLGDQSTGNTLSKNILTDEYGLSFIADSNFTLDQKYFKISHNYPKV